MYIYIYIYISKYENFNLLQLIHKKKTSYFSPIQTISFGKRTTFDSPSAAMDESFSAISKGSVSPSSVTITGASMAPATAMEKSPTIST